MSVMPGAAVKMREAVESELRRVVYVIARDAEGELGRMPVELEPSGLPCEQNYDVRVMRNSVQGCTVGFYDVDDQPVMVVQLYSWLTRGDIARLSYNGIEDCSVRA